MTRLTGSVAWCQIVLAQCRCGTTFPALPGVDRTGRCYACRQHAEHSRNRIDETTPGYRLAAQMATYSAALHLIGVIGERALTDTTGRRAALQMAVQEIVEVAGAAVFGVVQRDRPQLPAGLVPKPRTAPDRLPTSMEIA